MRKKYFKKQRFLETFDKFAQALFFQIPLGIPIVGFLLFGTITIAFNKDILAKIDTLGPVESFLRYSEYSIGIANLCLTTITVILIVYTLYLTKRANKKQFFETLFFDLLLFKLKAEIFQVERYLRKFLTSSSTFLISSNLNFLKLHRMIMSQFHI